MALKLTIVLPAYNAAETLASTVGEIPPTLDFELLLVDDHSRDHTLEIAQRLGIKTHRHTQNRGYGANQKSCYQRALAEGADVICMLHPDHQYDARTIPQLIAPLLDKRADITLGSRFQHEGGGRWGMPSWRKWGNHLLTHLQNRNLGLSLSEYHTGLRAYRREALERLPFLEFDDGFLFDQQILIYGARAGLTIQDIPTTGRYFPGASSISFADSVRYGLGTLHGLYRR